MPDVFVSNVTRQNRQLQYRAVEQRRVRVLSIPSGSQIKLPEQDTADEAGLEYVLKQLKIAGGVEAGDNGAIRGGFTLLYRVGGKPITSNQIDTAAEKDIAARQDASAAKAEVVGLQTFREIAQAAGPKLVSATTSIQEIEVPSGAGSTPVKKGVDFESEVSVRNRAGKPQRGKRNS